MQLGVDLPGQTIADSGDLGQLRDPGPHQLRQAAELAQKLLTAFRTEARDVLQRRSIARPGAALAMAGDGKPMRLVANLLDQMQGRPMRIQSQGLGLARQEKQQEPEATQEPAADSQV